MLFQEAPKTDGYDAFDGKDLAHVRKPPLFSNAGKRDLGGNDDKILCDGPHMIGAHRVTKYRGRFFRE